MKGCILRATCTNNADFYASVSGSSYWLSRVLGDPFDNEEQAMNHVNTFTAISREPRFADRNFRITRVSENRTVYTVCYNGSTIKGEEEIPNVVKWELLTMPKEFEKIGNVDEFISKVVSEDKTLPGLSAWGRRVLTPNEREIAVLINRWDTEDHIAYIKSLNFDLGTAKRNLRMAQDRFDKVKYTYLSSLDRAKKVVEDLKLTMSIHTKMSDRERKELEDLIKDASRYFVD